MENDPNKKESKGKRLLKKALRRGSKTSNNSQSSAQEQLSVSRSKSFETRRQSIEVKDSAPLPGADGAQPALRPAPPGERLPKKMVDIKESRNEIFHELAAVTNTDANDKSFKLDDTSPIIDAETSKKSLKRKLEDESGAGTSGASTGASDTDADDKDPSKDKKKKNRCAVCRKKVGLTGFECRCGGLFCAVHRYSDKHDCSFDYRELGAQEIRRNNPVVVSQKIHKI